MAESAVQEPSRFSIIGYLGPTPIIQGFVRISVMHVPCQSARQSAP